MFSQLNWQIELSHLFAFFGHLFCTEWRDSRDDTTRVAQNMSSKKKIVVQSYQNENFGCPASSTQFILKLSSSHPHVVRKLFAILLQIKEQSGGGVEWLFIICTLKVM